MIVTNAVNSQNALCSAPVTRNAAVNVALSATAAHKTFVNMAERQSATTAIKIVNAKIKNAQLESLKNIRKKIMQLELLA